MQPGQSNWETMVLWRGEQALRGVLRENIAAIRDEYRHCLEDLIPELERIRLMRVAREEARKRAKIRKRQRAVAEADRLNRGARQLLERRAQRDRANGDT